MLERNHMLGLAGFVALVIALAAFFAGMKPCTYDEANPINCTKSDRIRQMIVMLHGGAVVALFAWLLIQQETRKYAIAGAATIGIAAVLIQGLSDCGLSRQSDSTACRAMAAVPTAGFEALIGTIIAIAYINIRGRM